MGARGPRGWSSWHCQAFPGAPEGPAGLSIMADIPGRSGVTVSVHTHLPRSFQPPPSLTSRLYTVIITVPALITHTPLPCLALLRLWLSGPAQAHLPSGRSLGLTSSPAAWARACAPGGSSLAWLISSCPLGPVTSGSKPTLTLFPSPLPIQPLLPGALSNSLPQHEGRVGADGLAFPPPTTHPAQGSPEIRSLVG